MSIYNKIVLNGQTLIDLSNDTVNSSDDIGAGLVGHLNNGNMATGTALDGDVKFIDYDGTVLYTYSAAEFSALTAMPANPTHTGLTSQGWNWSLADAKAQVTAMGNCDIGQMYITNDGKTRVYISLVDSTRLSPYLGICPNGTVVVDWGDNTATNTLTGTSLTTVQRAQHTYASTGDYVITLTVTSGEFAIYGTNSSTNGTYLLTRTNGNIISQRYYQSAIQKVELGENVSLGIFAFSCCYHLSSITIPSSLSTLNNQAFRECYSLKSATIPSGITIIGDYTFFSCYSLLNIALPSSITTISPYAFQKCYSISNVPMPSGVASIGTYAFQACSSLVSVKIPSGVTDIANVAFGSCYSLSSVILPNGITSIGNSAFYYCYSLNDITIPSSVTTIGSNAFQYCYALASATIPSSVTSIATSTFNGCYSLESIIIPSGVANISASAFQDCPSLIAITLPNGSTSIDTSEFQNCFSLQSVNIPNSVTSIGTNAFSNCYALASITIPSGVTSISTYAFRNCYSMAEYHFLPTTPPTLSATNAFSNIPSDCKIYVPSASLTAYQGATNWSTYASYMVGE